MHNACNILLEIIIYRCIKNTNVDLPAFLVFLCSTGENTCGKVSTDISIYSNPTNISYFICIIIKIISFLVATENTARSETQCKTRR